MGPLIFLLILWLGMAWIFKSFIVAIIAIIIFIIGMIIWVLQMRSNKKLKEVAETKEYSEIQYRPIENKSSNNSVKQSISNNVVPKNYDVFHRNRDAFSDNMSYRLYQCKAVYSRTNRKRSVKIEAFDDGDVREQLQQSGFVEPFEIERISFPEVTDAQKAALGNIPYYDICQYDASALLSKKYEGDLTPNPELVLYAAECRMKFSYYIGKRALYDLIFNTLEIRDKIAFFVFCVYRYTTNDRQGNLNKSLQRDLFYRFSDENISNDAFIKSMNKYSGSNLRFFGTLTINHVQRIGGSTRTIAYQTAIEFLRKHFTLTTISDKTI